MMSCFEHWFGPYPFYEDGYKLVEVPYAGMEHQSSVTYGNYFENGYRKRDVSGTGWGMKFDFINFYLLVMIKNLSTKPKLDSWNILFLFILNTFLNKIIRRVIKLIIKIVYLQIVLWCWKILELSNDKCENVGNKVNDI